MDRYIKLANIESAKEFGRILVIAILPILVDSLTSDKFSLRGVLIALTVAALRAADKWVHENPGIKAKGILPF